MSRGAETYHRLKAAYGEFRTAVAAQRDACKGDDAEAMLAAAIEGDWLSARIAELHAERTVSTSTSDPSELVARAACAAEAEALAMELEALVAEVAACRDATATELAKLPTGGASGAYQAPESALFDAHG
jgi:primosomal protein N''